MEQPFEEKVVAEESVVVTKRGRKPKEESVEVEAVEETVNPNYQVSATDLIATLYTYAPSPVKNGNFKQAGKCLLCGVPTAAVERKICWECINKHRDELTVI
jgi:hypothetical protein